MGNLRCHGELGSSAQAVRDSLIQDGHSLIRSGERDLAKAGQSNESVFEVVSTA